MSPPFSGSKSKPSKKPARSRQQAHLLAACFMLVSCFVWHGSTLKKEEYSLTVFILAVNVK
jgi:hypothetical protein